jgi:hypothetical protein
LGWFGLYRNMGGCPYAGSKNHNLKDHKVLEKLVEIGELGWLEQ